MESINALDGKLAQVFGLASTIVGIQAAIVAIRQEAAAGLLFGLVPYVLIVAMAVPAYWVRVWSVVPDPLESIAYAQEGWPLQGRWWVAVEGYVRCHEDNALAQESKRIALGRAFTLLVGLVCLLVLTALALVWA